MQIRERQFLEKEIPNFKREILNQYRKFDKEFGLHGADVPIKFTFDENVLGSYTPKSKETNEYFLFSLYFLGFCNKDPMHRLDKLDLYAHEYAHYMAQHYPVPKEHQWKPGKHGSAWKYCCSLVGAAPTEYYRIGEGLEKHDYDKALYNPMSDPHYVMKDRIKQEKKYQDDKNRQIRYQVGETVEHPKFGTGTVEGIEQLSGSVRLTIRFGDAVKIIDQKWLLRSKYH